MKNPPKPEDEAAMATSSDQSEPKGTGWTGARQEDAHAGPPKTEQPVAVRKTLLALGTVREAGKIREQIGAMPLRFRAQRQPPPHCQAPKRNS